MGTSKASAHWEGTIKTGKGVIKPEHASEVGFSFASRFEGQASSNPEELVGAALAGCFSMALSSSLEKAGSPPRAIHTDAAVKLEKDGEGFSITSIELTTEADVPGLDQAKFETIAQATKKACPVSKALAGVGSITLKASLRSSAQ